MTIICYNRLLIYQRQHLLGSAALHIFLRNRQEVRKQIQLARSIF
jgi:hypothetical protein